MPISKLPAKVQLPGGVVLQGVPFKIVERNPEDGSPLTFQVLPAGTVDGVDCFLYANEKWIRSPL